MLTRVLPTFIGQQEPHFARRFFPFYHPWYSLRSVPGLFVVVVFFWGMLFSGKFTSSVVHGKLCAIIVYHHWSLPAYN